MGRRREVEHPAERPADEAASDPVDEASAESFPASDPPAWIVVHPGPPAPVAALGGLDRKSARRLPKPPSSSGS